MREFSGFCVAPFNYEFNVLRMQGGIRDLETALVEDWSPIRSDAAIRHFRLLVDRLASKNRWSKPSSWFHATGWNYDDFFHGRFRSRSERYIADLVEAQWESNWPYPMAEMTGFELFRRKVLLRLGMKKAFDVQVVLASAEPDTFLTLTRAYLADLLDAYALGTGAHTVVMHNTFEPFNPGRAIRYFDDAKCIIVDRDPRDNFVAQISDRIDRSSRVSPQIFVNRYRLYRRRAQRHCDPPGKVLRLQFESLVTEYEETLPRIMRFLGLTAADHVFARQYLNPEVSARNVGIWQAHPRPEEIEYIQRELREYCYSP